ncbi:MAG: PhoH family protein [Desulfovibrionales bacterium]
MTSNIANERKLEFHNADLARDLFGPQQKNLSRLKSATGVDISSRGTSVLLRSDDQSSMDMASDLLAQLYGLLQSGHTLHPQDFEHALKALRADPGADLRSLFCDTVFAVSPKKTVSPKSVNQRDYLKAMRTSDLVFGIGPAGTGKTYLAVAMAVSLLLQRKVKRLVLTRPAVEAGERLGFLPGDLMEKVNPYLRPLYDALHDMLGFQRVQEMLETGVIEVAPLAFMRGRTLNDAFVLLDEAQNTTPEQMKMFLTRMGFGSSMVVTGDVTQIDLPGHMASGLVQSAAVLSEVEGVGMIRFNDADVIRHPLVGRIVQAYGRLDAEKAEKAAEQKAGK